MNVVWLKRDLRLHDHEPLEKALQKNKPVLLLYIFEDIFLNDPHYSERHFRFIEESLKDLQRELATADTKVLVTKGDAIHIFSQLHAKVRISQVFSHQETGIQLSYQRDKEIAKLFKQQGIKWNESVNNGVFRGLKTRLNWVNSWEQFMEKFPLKFSGVKGQFLQTSQVNQLSNSLPNYEFQYQRDTNFQEGGRSMGLRYLNSFLKDRYPNYQRHISKPTQARSSCSRLSPYIAWGCLSIREIIHQADKVYETTKHKQALGQFMSRLRWQAHFIQKFEMEERIEFENFNPAFNQLEQTKNVSYIKAWKEGKTGVPLVDAAMRCLNQTGYLNFRMRALLVSFFTHLLWQKWQDASTHLASMFLDFEPGIHYPQLQMQAGTTGIHTLRIYNPIKNAYKQDADAAFTLKYVPELQKIPLSLVHEPWLMTPLEQEMYDFRLGEDYPYPIVDLEKTRKHASDHIWEIIQSKSSKNEGNKILGKHTIRGAKRRD